MNGLPKSVRFQFAIALLTAMNAGLVQGQVPTVIQLDPPNGSVDVSTATNIRLEFSSALNSQTVAGLRLLAPGGVPVPALIGTDATQGAVDIKPLVPLEPSSIYTVDVTSLAHGGNGLPVAPYTASFETGLNPIGGSGSEYRFSSTSLGSLPSVTSVAVGPDGNLYASDGIDSLWRYPLDSATGLVSGTPERIYQQAGIQTIGIAFSPSANAENLVLYTSHANRDNGGDLFTGTVSKFEIPTFGSGGMTIRSDVIVGLPHPTELNHQPNGIAFGPDGKLYQTVGGMATLGGSPNWGAEETLLSAAVLVADVEGDPAFVTPVDVNTATGYDPFAPNAPVQIFATGLRNAYDLEWHSNGQLYSGINANSLNGATTPDDPDQAGSQEINAKEHEMLALVREGLYYGHPNSARDEYILNGGNPTVNFDGTWEVSEYPIGVAPEPNFAGLPGTLAADGSASGPSGIIFDTRPSGGNSPDGIAEYTGPGALNGELLLAYFSGSRAIQTFALDPSTGLVTSTRPLENPAGQPISLNGPLDLDVESESGRIYVADFGLQADFGLAGRIVMLQPEETGSMAGQMPTASFQKAVDGSNPLKFTFDGSASSDDVGIERYVWDFGDGSSALGVSPSHVYPRAGRFDAKLTVVDSDGQISTTSMSLAIGTIPQALLVADSTSLTDADAAVEKRLQTLGFDVVVVSAGTSSASDAIGKDLVVISSTVNSGQVNTKFTNVAAGVVTWESYLFDDLRLTGNTQDVSYGFTPDLKSYLNVDADSLLAGGLSGDVLFSSDQQVFWGVPGPDADIIATLPDDLSRATFFTYEAGDLLFDGSTAAGNRVGLFLFNETASRLTSAGWRLFDNAILFASDLEIYLPGDFNLDGSVDGTDFLFWQRGGSPTPLSLTDLAEWQYQYQLGTAGSLTLKHHVVPEPATLSGISIVCLTYLLSFSKFVRSSARR